MKPYLVISIDHALDEKSNDIMLIEVHGRGKKGDEIINKIEIPFAEISKRRNVGLLTPDVLKQLIDIFTKYI